MTLFINTLKYIDAWNKPTQKELWIKKIFLNFSKAVRILRPILKKDLNTLTFKGKMYMKW